MDDEGFSFKKWLIILAVIGGAGWYVQKNYGTNEILRYTRENPSKSSPRINSMVGGFNAMRGNYPNAVLAYDQLLTDYPTSQYSPKALLRLGVYYTEQREFPKAIDAFEVYMEYFPEAEDFNMVSKKHELIKYKASADFEGSYKEKFREKILGW